MRRSFSIIIPTFNRPTPLLNCLEALRRLDYPRDRLEVIVVDDGGSAPLAELVLGKEWGFSVQLLRQPNGGPGSARNCGARAAVGDYLAFTDDDCCPEADWLMALDAAFDGQDEVLLGGHIVNGLPGNRYSTASQSMIDYLYDYFRLSRSNSVFFTSNNIAVKRTSFLALGGFHADFRLASEDREFCALWQCRGRALRYVPQARVQHFHQLSLRAFWSQHAQYGRGAARFHEQGSRGSSGVGFEPLWFYLGMFAFPFRQAASRQAAPVAALFAVSQLALAVGYCTEKLAWLPD